MQRSGHFELDHLEALDTLGIRLERVRVERLHVSTLTLGKYRVESERRLAAAAEAGYHSKALVRNFHIHTLQIMNASANYRNAVVSHLPS